MILDKCLVSVKDRVTGVLHVGAHRGQEADTYDRHGIKRVVWVEANPKLIPDLWMMAKPKGQSVIQAAVWSRPQEMTFRVSSNDGSSSSLLEMGTCKEKYDLSWVDEFKVTTTTLDQLAKDEDLTGINFLYLDIQGAEYEALCGAWKFLKQIDFVYTEVNFEDVYRGCHRPFELEVNLPHFTCTSIIDTTMGWGDAFYVRYHWSAMDLLPRLVYGDSRRTD